ncbi:hypothetical protein DERF_004583 [Dermatophagoides farinae]|uniref:Uncharacterized protein n=1 Tax=Dermatophagoides farinae TaxID=6954 RepID=A0A922L7V2_DERFA|nr:hypothetical protein DERF_004583 [Dermatophagoides farinae]
MYMYIFFPGCQNSNQKFILALIRRRHLNQINANAIAIIYHVHQSINQSIDNDFFFGSYLLSTTAVMVVVKKIKNNGKQPKKTTNYNTRSSLIDP